MGQTLERYLQYRDELEGAGYFRWMEQLYRAGGWQSRDEMHAAASQMGDPDQVRHLNFYAVTGLLDEMVQLYRQYGEALAQRPGTDLTPASPPSLFVAKTLSAPAEARLPIVQQWAQIVAVLTDNMVAEAQQQEYGEISPSVTESPLGSES
ncbi:hypothetical protein [Ferrimonas balearica]|uniref:hypothetical protein n=1 Tax=Ferrimonas balearica TaxID=44012 RepID=UPI001C9594AB|nr:hypothetical protein [Ferrimonas balearica]MBY6225759.1 hypothetical protein [Ferrimonas balearica]